VNIDDLRAGADLLHAAARNHADQDVADLYAAGGCYGEVIAALVSLAGQNVAEMERLSERVILRADDGQAPETHRRAALVHLAEMQSLLDRAHEAARRYHHAVGHLEVEVDPEAVPG
jgi:hypothetical protein